MTALRSVNLNLLPILGALLRRANVTHAARDLNMSQPAVSDALARLRLILHDELLIPSGRTFVLSILAQRLLNPVEETLTDIESLLTPAVFDPAQATGKIRIASSDYIGVVLGPRLVRKFAEQAPSMSFEIVDTHLDSNVDLRLGEVDLIIAPVGQIGDEFDQFKSIKLFDDRFVYVVGSSDGKPRCEPGEDLSARPHIFYQPRGRQGFMGVGESMLRQRHAKIAEAARVSSFLLIPFMIAGTDNVALIQRRVAEPMLKFTETFAIEPTQPFAPIQLVALWNRARENDPVHAWFRTLLSALSPELGN